MKRLMSEFEEHMLKDERLREKILEKNSVSTVPYNEIIDTNRLKKLCFEKIKIDKMENSIIENNDRISQIRDLILEEIKKLSKEEAMKQTVKMMKHFSKIDKDLATCIENIIIGKVEND